MQRACPRGAGSGCCAARRAAVKGPASRPFGRPSLTRARRHPPRSLARRESPDCGPGAWPVRSPMQRSRLRLHRDTEQRCQAGCAGEMTTAARSRARGSRALLPSRVRERGPLDELTGVSFTPLRFVRCAPARSSPRTPATPDAGEGPVTEARAARPSADYRDSPPPPRRFPPKSFRQPVRNVTVTRAPPSGRLRMSMVPPCRSMIVFETLSPSPVPFPVAFVVKKGSNTLCRRSSGTPCPASSFRRARFCRDVRG